MYFCPFFITKVFLCNETELENLKKVSTTSSVDFSKSSNNTEKSKNDLRNPSHLQHRRKKGPPIPYFFPFPPGAKKYFFPAPPFAILLAMIMELTAFEKAGKGLNEEAFLLLLHVYNPIGGGGGKFLFYPFPLY